MLQSLFVCRRLLTGGTVIPVSLIAVVPTVLEKSVFYGYLAVASVSLGLPTQFVHCCLAATRAFMLACLIVIPYTILEISKFLGQLPVDDDDDDEKCQLNASIASLRSELATFCLHFTRTLSIILKYTVRILLTYKPPRLLLSLKLLLLLLLLYVYMYIYISRAHKNGRLE